MSPNAEAGTFFVGFGVVVTTVYVVGILWRQKTGGLGQVPPPDPGYARQFAALADEEYDVVLTSGAWVNGVHATKPFARLLVTPGQIEVRVETQEPIRIVRGEVTGVRRVSGLYSRGVKFVTPSGRLDKLTVWPGRTGVRKLAELGWR